MQATNKILLTSLVLALVIGPVQIQAAGTGTETPPVELSTPSSEPSSTKIPAGSNDLSGSMPSYDKILAALGSVGLVCAYACIAHWAYNKGNPRFEKGFKKCTKKPRTEEGKDLHKALSKGANAIVGVLGSILIIKAIEKPLTSRYPLLQKLGFKGCPQPA